MPKGAVSCVGGQGVRKATAQATACTQPGSYTHVRLYLPS